MKRLTAVIIAALIAASFPIMAFAVPEDGTSSQTSSEASNTESSNAQETSEETSKTENSKASEASESVSSAPAQESSAAVETDPDKMKFATVNIPSVGMNIELPQDAYILTKDISPDDPALTAVKLTKQDVEKSFTENNTAIRAFANDFSYDVIVTIFENDRTRAIGDLSSLEQKEMDNIVEELMKNEYAKGNSIVTYNDVMYVNLDMEYSSGDTHIYGMQEYTIVGGYNVIITFQVHDGKMEENHKKLFSRIMSGVKFDSVAEKPVISNVAQTKVGDLDVRYLMILGCAVVGVITLGAMIIVGSRYRNSQKEKFIDERIEEDNYYRTSKACSSENDIR